MESYQTGITQPEKARRPKPVNVGHTERKASMVGGTALALSGLGKLAKGRVLSGLLLIGAGGMVFARGKTGHCNMYEALGVDTTGVEEKGIRLEKAITINRPPQQVYEFWRDLSNLPRFMRHVDSVQVTGPGTSHWRAVGAGDLAVEWDAEIVSDEPGRRIVWRSIGDADIPNEGVVEFLEAPGNSGCALTVAISYSPPGGAVGKAAAKFLHAVNAQQLEDDLKRLKQILETGELATAMAV